MSFQLDSFTPKIYMKLGRIKGTKASVIKFTIYRAVLAALEKAVALTVLYLMLILPESRFRKPPYPPSYKTERLAATAIHVLKKSLVDLKAKGFKVSNSFYSVFLDFPASYTPHANEMVGVRWSKPTTEEGFVEKSEQKLIENIRTQLRLQTVKFKGENISLTTFVSRVTS